MLRKIILPAFLIIIFLAQGCVTYRLNPEDDNRFKKESVDVDSFANLIKQNNKSFVRELKFVVQEECRKLDEKKYEIISDLRKTKFDSFEISKEEIQKILKEEFQSLKGLIQPICPKCNLPMLLKQNRDRTSKFWECSNYPNCKCTSSYEEY